MNFDSIIAITIAVISLMVSIYAIKRDSRVSQASFIYSVMNGFQDLQFRIEEAKEEDKPELARTLLNHVEYYALLVNSKLINKKFINFFKDAIPDICICSFKYCKKDWEDQNKYEEIKKLLKKRQDYNLIDRTIEN